MQFWRSARRNDTAEYLRIRQRASHLVAVLDDHMPDEAWDWCFAQLGAAVEFLMTYHPPPRLAKRLARAQRQHEINVEVQLQEQGEEMRTEARDAEERARREQMTPQEIMAERGENLTTDEQRREFAWGLARLAEQDPKTWGEMSSKWPEGSPRGF